MAGEGISGEWREPRLDAGCGEARLGYEAYPKTDGHFSDVPANNEIYQYVETVYNRHIVTGFQGGVFKPWDNVKRGQIAKIVVLAAGLSSRMGSI